MTESCLKCRNLQLGLIITVGLVVLFTLNFYSVIVIPFDFFLATEIMKHVVLFGGVAATGIGTYFFFKEYCNVERWIGHLILGLVFAVFCFLMINVTVYYEKIILAEWEIITAINEKSGNVNKMILDLDCSAYMTNWRWWIDQYVLRIPDGEGWIETKEFYGDEWKSKAEACEK